LAAWLAAGALMALAAAPLAVAQGPAGGYNDAYHRDTYTRRGGSGLSDAWSVALVPLRWLRQSSRSFQGLMRLLAERSARYTGDEPPFPFPPQRELPGEPPGAEEDDRPRRSPDGGEARAGRDPTSAVRVKTWRKWAPSCRHAGVAVPPGGRYVVHRGDTLWSVAEAHYGFGGAYRRILRANWQSIPDPELIYPCQRLYIPHWRWSGYPAEEPVSVPVDPAYGLVRLESQDDPRRGGPAQGGSNAENGWP
jgi:nucleoid-associated protein YgaU